MEDANRPDKSEMCLKPLSDMEDANRLHKSGMCVQPHSDACLDKPWKMPTDFISLKCVANLIPTLVLDKPRKMLTDLMNLKCV